MRGGKTGATIGERNEGTTGEKRDEKRRLLRRLPPLGERTKLRRVATRATDPMRELVQEAEVAIEKKESRVGIEDSDIEFRRQIFIYATKTTSSV